jgi:hypothetical protein
MASSLVSFLPQQGKRSRAVRVLPLQHYHHKMTMMSTHDQLMGEGIGNKWLLSNNSKESTAQASSTSTRLPRVMSTATHKEIR